MIIDPARHLIILETSSISATELYSRSIDWLATGDNSKYDAIFRIAGGDDLGGGLSIPPYFFLQGFWRIKPMEANQTLTITGNLFVEGGGDPVISTDGVFQVLIKSVIPVQAQGISTGGSLTLNQIESSSVLAKEATSQSILSKPQLSSIQSTMLLEMYNLLGLDPSIPLIVTDMSRTAGSIHQNISTSQSETIVMRV